jgi:sacsin
MDRFAVKFLESLASTSFLLDEYTQEFGQSVELVDTIENIRRDYSPQMIFNEFIQNADDAGAKEVVVTFDDKVHGQSTLLSKNLTRFQGPALYVYNDATFSEQDFHAIKSIGSSALSKKNRGGKMIGKFGLGFNVAYHYTDFPSILSRDRPSSFRFYKQASVY